MIYIAHRGNLYGKNPNEENKPDYIKAALNEEFDVEIDVWYIDGKFILGHDLPQYPVNADFLKHPCLWCHAKNIKALYELQKLDTNCFYHNTDAAVLTSKGIIWTYPGEPLTENSVCVMPEWNNQDYRKALGVCSDLVGHFRQALLV